MKYDYDAIVIGAGSAGLVVASGAAGLGAKVALIESGDMGGDCLNTGCVPSKTFLKSAHLKRAIDQSALFGLEVPHNHVHMNQVMDRVQSVIAAIAPHDSVERFEGLGVTVFKGVGTFENPHAIKVNGQVITGKKIVIATGSKPAIPAIEGIQNIPYLTNESLFSLKTLPRHLIVLGAGPMGLEMGQGFKHLGSQVSIVYRGTGLFAKDEPEVGPLMEKIFLKEGIALYSGATPTKLEKEGESICVHYAQEGKSHTLMGDQVLVSMGRVPHTEHLNLSAAGVKTDEKGYVITSATLQTNVPNVYACGDVTGPYLFTHTAAYQAGLVIRNALLHLKQKQRANTKRH